MTIAGSLVRTSCTTGSSNSKSTSTPFQHRKRNINVPVRRWRIPFLPFLLLLYFAYSFFAGLGVSSLHPFIFFFLFFFKKKKKLRFELETCIART